MSTILYRKDEIGSSSENTNIPIDDIEEFDTYRIICSQSQPSNTIKINTVNWYPCLNMF